MRFRNFSHLILVLDIIRFPLQGKLKTTLTIRHRVTQQSLESCCFDHTRLPRFQPATEAARRTASAS